MLWGEVGSLDPRAVGGFSPTVLRSVVVSGGKAQAMMKVNSWARTVASRMRGKSRDAGAGFVEYAGLMIIIAGIFTLIDQLALDSLISGAIRTAVTSVTGG